MKKFVIDFGRGLIDFTAYLWAGLIGVFTIISIFTSSSEENSGYIILITLLVYLLTDNSIKKLLKKKQSLKLFNHWHLKM